METYWTALPEAIRGVIGDPFSEPTTLSEFKELIEEAVYVEPETKDCYSIRWESLPESEVCLEGFVELSAKLLSDAEYLASDLAVSSAAFQILYSSDTDIYHVCGMSIDKEDRGFFDWVIHVSEVE